MSLKKFHIFFISISALLCLGMIFWGVWYYKAYGQWSGFLYAGLGAAGTGILYIYLKWFLKKYSKLMSLGLASMAGSVFLTNSKSLWACGVCFKDPDSPLTQSTLLGVGVLLVVIVGVLLSIVLIARSWIKRAKALNVSL